MDGLAVPVALTFFLVVIIGFEDSFRYWNCPKFAILILSLLIGVRPLAVFILFIRKSRNCVVLEEFPVNVGDVGDKIEPTLCSFLFTFKDNISGGWTVMLFIRPDIILMLMNPSIIKRSVLQLTVRLPFIHSKISSVHSPRWWMDSHCDSVAGRLLLVVVQSPPKMH